MNAAVLPALAAVCLSPLAPAPTGDADAWTLKPVKGWELTVSMHQEAAGELLEEETTFLVDGEEEEFDDEDSSEQTSRFELSFTFVDRFEEVEDGRITELVRTFGDFEGEQEFTQVFDGESLEGEASFYSPLEQLALRFTWDEENEEYAVEFEDGEGEEDLLERQRLEAHLSPLLPAEAPEVGDTWDAGPAGWIAIEYLGGDFAIDLRWEEMEEDGNEDGRALADDEQEAYARIQLELDDAVRDALKGTVECTFQEIRKLEDRRLAVVHLEIALAGEAEAEDEYEDEEGYEYEVTSRVEVEYAFEGELLWDLDLGVPHSLEIEGEVTMASDDVEEYEIDGMGCEFRMREVWEMQVEIGLTYELSR